MQDNKNNYSQKRQQNVNVTDLAIIIVLLKYLDLLFYYNTNSSSMKLPRLFQWQLHHSTANTAIITAINTMKH